MAGAKINKGKCLGQMEIMAEIKLAKKEERQADFSNQTLADLSIVFDKIKFGLNLENAVILGPVFFSEILSNGDFNLKNIQINGSLYLARSEIKGNLILENAKISGTVNLVGAKIDKSLLARGMANTGFLSLAKTEIDGDVILENVEIYSANYSGLAIRGDLFLDSSSIKGTLNLSKISVDGILDLEGASIGKDLIISEAKIKKEKTDTTKAKIGGRKIS